MLDVLLGKEHGRLIEDEHRVLVTASRAVPAEVFGGPDDREPRLVDRRQLARLLVEVEADIVAVQDGRGALGAPGAS